MLFSNQERTLIACGHVPWGQTPRSLRALADSTSHVFPVMLL